jgi:NADPH-dependent ferric siderophore reductase
MRVVAREFSYFPAYVVCLTQVTPHLRRLVLGGVGAAGWACLGQPDEAVLLVLPERGDRLVMPDDVTEGDPHERSRWYTVRGYDSERDELAVDLAAHPVGLTSRWARSVEPGDPVGVSSPHSWWDRPADATWQVLIGDLTALPLISRVLEEVSEGLHTQVVVEVPEAADEQRLMAPAGAEVRWVHTLHGQPSTLESIARSMYLPPGPGYVYVAGESSATRGVRKHLRHERGLGAQRYSVAGYWRDRSEEWMQRFHAVQAQLGLEELYARFEAPDADKEALNDELDRRLAAAGL